MFESSVELTPEQIKWLDECTQGTGSWQLNPTTGLVDVNGHFDCRRQNLRDFKRIRFGEVRGSFWCGNNRLTSLEGAPQKVGWDFDCDNNQLATLVGAPQEVGWDFDCINNQLTTLEGAPQEIRGGFICHDNELTTLEGAPQKVGMYFHCSDNGLTSLEGAPREVGGNFYCEENPVSEKTLKRIFRLMKKGESYLKAVESIWTEIPLEDQTLLYRPEFGWVGADEARKLEALKAYQGFKSMI